MVRLERRSEGLRPGVARAFVGCTRENPVAFHSWCKRAAMGSTVALIPGGASDGFQARSARRGASVVR
jgi:hypothetical protein